MLFLIMYSLHINFCAISINRNSDVTILKVLENLLLHRPLSSYTTKIISMLSLKLRYCMQNFVRFHVIESELELLQEFWGKRHSRARTELYVPKLHHCYF